RHPVRRFERPLGAEAEALAAAVERALGPATRMVVVSDLHNPSGVTMSEPEAAALGRLAERLGFWILCDETYRDAALSVPRGGAATGGERWISTSSLTKSYGLGGLRIGWVAAGPKALERCAVLQNALSVLPAEPSVGLALGLIPHLERLRDRAHAILTLNHAR